MTAVRYLALGDSYTIGTGASSVSRNFPSLLARRLEEAIGVPVAVQNPAVNGYTTSDLIDRELPQVTGKPDLCTVLIGANDIVQGFSAARYRRNLETVYGFIERFQLPGGRTIAISIPDFSWVPGAAPFGTPAALRQRIDDFNAVAREEAKRGGLSWIDLVEVGRPEIGRTGWIAEDQLHPSDAQYAAWAAFIWPQIRADWTSASG